MSNEVNKSEIIIYQSDNGDISLKVNIQEDNIWLNRHQMSILFDRDIKTIGKHINSALREELEGIPVVAKFATTASDGKSYQTEHYNIEMITSIGYRVKSKQGVQFRIWANKVLKEYLLKGYVINNNAKVEQLTELKAAVKLLSNVIDSHPLTLDEATGLLKVITDYTYALDTLDKYDYQQLKIENTSGESGGFRATYKNAMEAIATLRNKFGSGGLFGNEKDESFKSSIGQIYQTFAEEELYPSIEEKAAVLLYLITKNHSFSDGNKRIAAFIFLWFLNNNKILYRQDGTQHIGNNTLVALTLMIAESRVEEMNAIIKVIVNLINKNN